MTAIGRWTIHFTLGPRRVRPERGPAGLNAVVSGETVSEPVEVVRASDYEGAVARFAKIEALISDHFAAPGGATQSLREAQQLAANAGRALGGSRP